jgi:cytoplasmic tRNA 2-thiolation protein 1
MVSTSQSVHHPLVHRVRFACRLSRCVNIVTGGDGPLPRVKPFKYTYEKEIVMYAYFKKLDYFSTECVYAPFAARGFARDFVKDLEVSGTLGMHWRPTGHLR